MFWGGGRGGLIPYERESTSERDIDEIIFDNTDLTLQFPTNRKAHLNSSSVCRVGRSRRRVRQFPFPTNGKVHVNSTKF